MIDYGGASELVDGDSFMICSDGLWAYFSDEEMGGVLSVYSAREAAEIFIKRARERGRPTGDNVSLIIIKLVDVEARQKADKERLDAARRKLGKMTV